MSTAGRLRREALTDLVLGPVRYRIESLDWVPASDLLSNKRNWRRHSTAQKAALRDIVQKVGFADALIAYRTEDGLTLIDGHLRASMVSPEEKLPVIVLDVDAKEADRLLATIDTLGHMAETDTEALSALLQGIEESNREIVATLHDIPSSPDFITEESEEFDEGEEDEAGDEPRAPSSPRDEPAPREKADRRTSTWGVLSPAPRCEKNPILRCGEVAAELPRPLYERFSSFLAAAHAENHQAGVMEVLTLGLDAAGASS